LIDIHVHFMPDRVQEKVWSFFDTVGPRTGIDWPISYRLPDAVRLELLRASGVRAFPGSVPGIKRRPGDGATAPRGRRRLVGGCRSLPRSEPTS